MLYRNSPATQSAAIRDPDDQALVRRLISAYFASDVSPLSFAGAAFD
jgi:hypothetical protein